MADLDRIKRNVAKMAEMNAPETDIDGYIASEGVTLEQVRNHKIGSQINQPTSQPKPAAKPQPKKQLATTGDYADIINNTTMSKAQKQVAIQNRYDEINKRIDEESRKAGGRIALGATLQGASMHPVLNIPYIGTGIGGALFDAGGAIVEGKKLPEIAKQAGRGFIIGETIGTVPYVGKLAGKTKLGQYVVNQAGKLGSNIASSKVGKAVGKKIQDIVESEVVKKAAQELSKERYLTKTGARKAAIAKRKAIPLEERMTAEQLERATKPKMSDAELDYLTMPDEQLDALTRPEKVVSAKLLEPSNFGVREENTVINQQLADEVNNKVLEAFEQIKDYENYRKEITKKYGSIDKIRKTLAQEADEYGRVENVDMQQALDRLLEKQQNLDNNPYLEYAKNINPRNKGFQKAIKKKENIDKFVEEQPVTVEQEVLQQPEIVQPVKAQAPVQAIPEQVVQPTAQPTGKMKKSRLAQKANKSDEVAQAIEENPPLYEAIANADTMAQAEAELAQNVDRVHTDIVKKLVSDETEVTALDIEKTRQLFNELQKQGRFDEATELLELTTKQGSKLGQAVQAFSLWSKTTPDGAMLYAQKLLDKYNKGVTKKLQKQLSEKEMREIGEAFQKLNESGLTGRELEVETAKAMKKVFKVVPKTFAQKLDGNRYINMLLSPQSRIKDFILTAKNAPETAIDETLAGGIDYLRTLGSKDKTRYVSANPLVGMKPWFAGAKKGFKNKVEDIKYGINTSRSGEVGRYGLPNTPTFEAQELEGDLAQKALTFVKNTPAYAEKLLRYTMQVPDSMFFEGRFASSLANQMKARGVTEPTQDMINSALKEAKRAVFQEDRAITEAMQKGAELIDTPIHILENNIGLPQGTLPTASKGLVPFVKTPTNVIAQGAEGLHGLGSGLLKLKNANGNPELIREAELLMGRGLRGVGELGLGVALGKGVWDKVKTNIGEKDYYANEITGLQPSSVVIGDKAFSMQNMQNNLPFFTGVGLGQRGLGQALTNTTDIIAEMPALKALGDLYNINKEANYIAQSNDPDKELIKKGSRMARSLGANYLTSLIPVGGWLGELRNDIDPYARELYAPDRYDEGVLQGLSSDAEYLRNRVQNRIPGLSKLLPTKYNALGQPVMSNNIDNDFLRALSQSVNFGVRNYNAPPAEIEEMQRLQDFAMENNLEGKTTLKFAKPKRYIGKGKDKLQLTNEEYSELTRLYNGKVFDELQFLMNTPEYQEQDEETQIKWVKEVMKEKKKEAEEELFEKFGIIFQ